MCICLSIRTGLFESFAGYRAVCLVAWITAVLTLQTSVYWAKQSQPVLSLLSVRKELEYKPLLSQAQISLDNLAYSRVELGQTT